MDETACGPDVVSLVLAAQLWASPVCSITPSPMLSVSILEPQTQTSCCKTQKSTTYAAYYCDQFTFEINTLVFNENPSIFPILPGGGISGSLGALTG